MWAAVFEHDIGIRFNGRDRFDVEEYCVSEAGSKVPAGKTLTARGKPCWDQAQRAGRSVLPLNPVPWSHNA